MFHDYSVFSTDTPYKRHTLMSSFMTADRLLLKIFIIFRFITISSFQKGASLITTPGSLLEAL